MIKKTREIAREMRRRQARIERERGAYVAPTSAADFVTGGYWTKRGSLAHDVITGRITPTPDDGSRRWNQ
jgi:hypothetical protein